MEDIKSKRSQSANVTPTEGAKFKFPSDGCSSVDRLRDISNFLNSNNHSRRSFTPSIHAFCMNSPDISPINPTLEFNFKRMKPEKVAKAKADSTVSSTDDSMITDDFILMPPPPPRKPAGSGIHEASLEFSARQRRMERIHANNTSNSRKARKAKKKSDPQPVVSGNDILNIPVSLNSLLLDIGLDRYIELFETKEIDLEVFLTMDDGGYSRHYEEPVGYEAPTYDSYGHGHAPPSSSRAPQYDMPEYETTEYRRDYYPNSPYSGKSHSPIYRSPPRKTARIK